VALALLAWMFSQPVQADKLIFRTGNSVDGVVLEESPEQVVFRDRGGEVRTYSKSLIQSVVREEHILGVSVADVL